MIQALDSYIYTGVSFSTFSFDLISSLCIRYSLAKFTKKRYYSLIYKYLKNKNYFEVNDNSINYFIHNILRSLESATLLLTTNKKEVKLAKKYLKKEVCYSSPFKIIDLSLESKSKNACFILSSKEEQTRYRILISCFSKVKFIFLDDIIDSLKKSNIDETIYDKIKIKILQDNDSEVFFVSIDIFTNIACEFVYSLNKIAIGL